MSQTQSSPALVGRNIRGLIYDMLREAEKLTGEAPYLVTYAEGEPAIIWATTAPSLEAAARLSVNTSPVQAVFPVSYHQIAGTHPTLRPVSL